MLVLLKSNSISVVWNIMSFANVDPQFRSYLREPPRISYTNPDDAWLVRHFVSSIEILLGRNKIEAVYNNLKDEQFNLTTFFQVRSRKLR